MGLSNEVTPRGSGPLGPYWAPIPYSWPYPAGRRRRGARKAKHWKLLSSITGRIDIYLKRGRTEAPGRGPAGWFADNLGLFAKQTEKYRVKEFLMQYARFLSEVHYRTVLLAEVDYEEIYVGTANKGPSDLNDALARIYEHVASSGEGNKVLLSTFGRTNIGASDGLEITLEAQYNRKHGHGKPGIEVRILLIPSILAKRPQKGEKAYNARTHRLLYGLSDAGKEKFAMRYENTAKILLKDYEQRLHKFFDVAKTSRWLHLEWGKTVAWSTPRVKL